MIQYEPWSNRTLAELTKDMHKGAFSCLDLELSGECPYNCVYCETPYRNKKSRLDIDKVCLLLETKKIKWIYICGIGEPAYAGNETALLKILESCRRNGAKCSIFTNLSNLSDEIISYIKEGVLFCLFKFDSQDRQVIDGLYRLSDIEQHLSNLQRLVKLVRCEKGETNLAASIVPTSRNVAEIPSLVKWCVERNIFPLVAQLEYAGAAKYVYEQLLLDDEELRELKAEIEKVLGEKYRVPFCPALISGICITCDNEIVIDRRTGLSCHSFWLEDPQREIVYSDFSALLTMENITNTIVKARCARYKEFLEHRDEYKSDVFGGCGGNKSDVFDFYTKSMVKGFTTHTANHNLKINRFVYLDNNATTRMSDVVREVMLPYFSLRYANPNSNSQLGRDVRLSIDRARQQVAESLGCEAKHIFFTGSGSEGNSWAIKNCVENEIRGNRKTILSTAIEHDSILNYLKDLQEKGYHIFEIPVSDMGCVDIDALLRNPPPWEDVCFASIMYVNNETGVINDIKRLAGLLREQGVPFHCDAVQAYGKLRLNMEALGADYLTVSGHKIHAPKGIGAMYVREPDRLRPIIFGHQEEGKRGGTENVAFIAALGAAAELAYPKADGAFEKRTAAIRTLRNRLEKRVKEYIRGVTINGAGAERISNTSNMGFTGIDAVKLTLLLESRGIYVSNGSACNASSPKYSHVLKAMRSPTYENGAIRVSLSDETEERDIDYFVDNLVEAIRKLEEGE